MSGINIHLWPEIENVTPRGAVTPKSAQLSVGSAFKVVLGIESADEAWLRLAAVELDKLADAVSAMRATKVVQP